MKTKAKVKRVAKKREVAMQTEILDPRQIEFLVAYTDPKSPTFANALQSGLRAGFSQEYSETITSRMPDWLANSVGNSRKLALAEKHFEEVLEMPIITQAMGAFGPIFEKRETWVQKKFKNGKTRKVKKVEKIPVMKHDTSRIKEKTKVAEIVAEAHNPALYGKQRGPKVSFTFNAAGAKARYST